MSKVTFITGNKNKAMFLKKHLGIEVGHKALDLDEIQSLDIKEVSIHKAKQAFSLIKSPVLVEDVGYTILALGKLPGPFIKWFEKELGLEGICKLVDGLGNRKATVEIVYTYFDGRDIVTFESQERGSIPAKPRGELGFGWNPIFVPDGAIKTYAEMNEEETAKYSLRSPVLPKIKMFLSELDNK